MYKHIVTIVVETNYLLDPVATIQAIRKMLGPWCVDAYIDEKNISVKKESLDEGTNYGNGSRFK